MFQWRIDSVRTLNSIHRLYEQDLEHRIQAVRIIRREWRQQQWPVGAKETILRQSQGSLAQLTLSIGYDMAVKDILSKIIDTKKNALEIDCVAVLGRYLQGREREEARVTTMHQSVINAHYN